jgi:very-short-patch-repair endonuclease
VARAKYVPPSKIAARCFTALNTLGMTVLPEVNVGERLEVDFIVRELNLALECDGKQHDEFSAFFHGTKDGFRDSKKRDNRKQVLCEEQGLKLVRLSEKEIMQTGGPEELISLILQKLKQQQQSEEEEW